MRTDDFLARLKNVTKSGAGFQARCPGHEDRNASLSITTGDDGKVLLHCHAGCRTEDICAAVGWTLADLFPEKATGRNGSSTKPVEVASYDYCDENGAVLYQVVRYVPKTFRQRQKKDGEWVWNMEGVRHVLYRLPDVMAQQDVVIVEGEKDADNLGKLGFCATCNAGGAGKWKDSYTEALGGKNVVVIPDNDPAGRKHADLVIESLKGKAAKVFRLELPAPHKDASDFIRHHGDKAKAELLRLLDANPHGPAVSLGSIRPAKPEDTLIGERRFACRGGGFALIGPTGVGKSSLTMQMAIRWALGRECFGFKPMRPLRSLIVQAENDEGDLFEMRDGIYEGLKLSAVEREQVAANVAVKTIDDATGLELIGRVTRLLDYTPLDLFWLDNYYAYLGGSVSDQELATQFLRHWLAPVLRAKQVAAMIIHHPPKPPREETERKVNEYAYMGAGSVELANWARGSMYLEPTKDVGIFRLILGKRGGRVGWKESDGLTSAYSRLIAHGKGGLIYWRDADESEQTAVRAPRPFSKEDIMPHVPVVGAIDKSALQSKCQAAKCAVNRFNGFLAELLNDGAVHEWRIKRPRTNPLIRISRHPQTLESQNGA